MKTVQKIGAIAIALLMIASVIPTAVADPWGYLTGAGGSPQAFWMPNIVVGQDAAAMDVAGAIDIAGSAAGVTGFWNYGMLDTEATMPGALSNPLILVGSNRPVAPTMNPANRLVKELVDNGQFKDFANRGAASLTDGRDGVVEIVNDAWATGQQAIVVAGVARQGTRMACRQAAEGIPNLYTTFPGTGLPGIETDIENFLGFGPGAPTEQCFVSNAVAQAVIEGKKIANPTTIDLTIGSNTWWPVAANTAEGRAALRDYIDAQIPGTQTVTVTFTNTAADNVQVDVNGVTEYNAAPTYIAAANLDASTKEVYMVTNRYTGIDAFGWIPPQTLARQVGYNAVFLDTTAGREDMNRAAYMLGALQSLKNKNIYNTNLGANLRYADLYSLVFEVGTPTITPGTIIIIT